MITIVIPTMNRPDFLVRLLRYYIATKYSHWIYIGDSSNTFCVAQTKKIIQELKGKLNIKYFEYPRINDSECIKKLLDDVVTPYVAFLADDDFLIPSGLEKCVRFLKEYPNYTVSLGKAILFILNKSGPYGEFAGVSGYRLRSIEANTATQRILDHLGNYSNPNFGVHRTEQFKEAYSHIAGLTDKGLTEILPNCISCVQGKIKQLDCFYLVRQGHDLRYLLPDTFDWIISKHWPVSYEIFENNLSKTLAEKDCISLQKAREIVKQAFWAYLERIMTLEYKEHYNMLPHNHIKQCIKGIPGVASCVHKIKSYFFSKGMSLPTLLNTRSPHHNDFMPVYNSINSSHENGSKRER